MVELHELMRPLERLEALMEEIYEVFRERFSDDPEGSELFARLAHEERAHLSQVQYLRRLVRRSGHTFAALELALDDVQGEVELLEGVRDKAAGITLEQAVAVAVVFERGVGEAHARQAVAMTNSDLAMLLQNQSRADRQHAATLVAFALRRGIGTP